jgi:hypothetical protein
MAYTSLQLLLLAQQYRSELARQANRRALTLSILRKVPGAGKNVTIPIETSGQGAGAYQEGADTVTFGQDGQAAGVLNWGLYEAPVSITNLAVDAAASTSAGPDGNDEAFGRQLVNGAVTLCSTVNVDLFQGTGTSGGAPNVVGFGSAIGSTSNTYAGIDRSIGGNALFRPNVSDPGSSAPLTVQLIRKDLAAAFVRGGARPDIALVTPDMFNTVAALFDPLRRMETDTVQAAGSPVVLPFKVSTLVVDGCQFIEDKDASLAGDTSAVGSIIYLNTDYVEIETLMPALNRKAYQMMAAKGMMPATDGFSALDMALFYQALAITGSAVKARVALTAQLKVTRPNACAVRRNVTIL